MREILFRGKRIDNKEWVEGLPFGSVYGGFSDGAIDSIRQTVGRYGDIHGVVIETVGQYTGFTDKNGKKIFEGDIVRFDYVDDDGNDAAEDFLIFFEHGAFRAQYLGNIKCAPNTLYDEIGTDECYVVGNKWDNPELLEVKK